MSRLRRYLAATVLSSMGIAACDDDHACPGFCGGSGDDSVVLELSCAPTDIQSVQLSGPCTSGGDPEWSTTMNLVEVFSREPGTCTIALSFASGFRYVATAQFTEYSAPASGDGCCPAATAIGASPEQIVVNNPPTTCLRGDVPADAGSLVHD